MKYAIKTTFADGTQGQYKHVDGRIVKYSTLAQAQRKLAVFAQTLKDGRATGRIVSFQNVSR